MMNSKVKNVIKHNVETSIRNKWFYILNVLLLLVTVVSFNIGNVDMLLKNKNISFGSSEKLIIGVDDSIGGLKEEIEKNITLSNLDEKLEVKTDTNAEEYTKDTIEDNFINVVINSDDKNFVNAKIISKDAINSKYLDVIETSIENIRQNLIAKELNIKEEDMSLIRDDVKVERVMLSINEASDNTPLQIARMAINYVVFFILIMVLSATASAIAQEKTSKSIEYVLTSISSKDYLLSKVLSTIIVYVIQFIFTILYMLIGMYLNSIINMQALSTQGVASDTSIISYLSFIDAKFLLYIGITFVYSLLTIFILNVIQAVLSSKTTNITEAGNTTIILLMVNLILYLMSNFIIDPFKVPSIFVYVISCIPIVSMYFIPSMIAVSQANIIQVIISTILLVVAIPLVLKIGAKFFKQGVLNTSSVCKNSRKNTKKNLSDEELRDKKLLKREYSKTGYVLGLSVILYIVISIVLSLMSAFISAPLTNLFNGRISQENITCILTCITSCIALFVPYLLLRSYTNKDEIKKDKASKSKSFIYVLMGIPCLTIIQILTSLILNGINVDYNVVDKLNIYNGDSIFSIILFFIQIAILPAIFEELYMRRGVVDYTKKYGSTFAIITSSIMFASIHLNLSQSIFAFMIGCVFAYIATKTNRIFPTMLLHFINNGMSALMLIFKDNLIIAGLIGFLYILLNVVGIIMIIITCVFKYKEKKEKKKVLINKEDIRENNKDLKEVKNKKGNILQIYKAMITDYTFIITVIAIIILNVYTEKMLNIL